MNTETKISIANPSPLGLLGFGMTTLLLNLHNAELIQLSVVIVAMGLALGGAAQVIAGMMEFFKNSPLAPRLSQPTASSGFH